MSDERKRKIDADGPAPGPPMTVDQAKALLRERKHKDRKGEKISKKIKYKKERKDKHKKKRRRKDDSSSDSSDSDSSDSDSDTGGGKQRRWMTKSDGRRDGKKKKTDWGSPPDESTPIQPIAADDYYLRNKEFSVWLRHTHGLFFTDLLAADARARFTEFVKQWNERKLPKSFYDDEIDVSGRR